MTDTTLVNSLETGNDPRELALRIADILAETPASDTVVLDIRDLSSFADFFVICSGDRMVRSYGACGR